MRTFADNAGRTWTVAVEVDALKRVKGLLGVDLMQLVEERPSGGGPRLLERLMGDPVLLCDVVYCLVKPQADQQNVSDEDFGRAMAGDAIEAATTAFLEEIVDFFPSRRRGLLRTALAKLRDLDAAMLTAAETRLNDPRTDARLQAAMDEELRRLDAELPTPGPSSGSAPASSAAPQGP